MPLAVRVSMASSSVGSSSSLSRMTWKPNWLSTGAVETSTSASVRARQRRGGRLRCRATEVTTLRPAPGVSRHLGSEAGEFLTGFEPRQDVICLLLGRNQDVRRAIEFASASVIAVSISSWVGCFDIRLEGFADLPDQQLAGANCCNSSSVICCASRNSSRPAVRRFFEECGRLGGDVLLWYHDPELGFGGAGDDLLLDEESEGAGELGFGILSPVTGRSGPRHRRQ